MEPCDWLTGIVPHWITIILVSPLGGPHSIRGVGKLATSAALSRVTGHRPFLSVEWGSRGARVIDPGAGFMFYASRAAAFWASHYNSHSCARARPPKLITGLCAGPALYCTVP